MNGDSRVNLRWPVAVAAAIVLLAIGAVGSYIAVTRGGPRHATTGRGDAARDARPPEPRQELPARVAGAPLTDVAITLSDEAVKRAGISVAAVESGSAITALRLPAVVEPNAYKQVTVTPLVSGRVTRVVAELGARVRQGQTMATIFSPELAEARTRYVSAKAELEAHERELARTEKLVQIGAASRQELERIHAEHTSQLNVVESARSRLELLGMTRESLDRADPGQADAHISVPAPISGVVTERLANVGLNVDPATKLFAVVDLSTVWVVADLYERDFSRVHVGDPVTIATTAYPDERLRGRVDYIDPQLNAATRTAKVRVEVANPRNALRLGMLAEAQIQSPDQVSVPLVPRAAVQNVADRTVVYLVKPGTPGQFIEREVRLGQPSGDRVQVLSGVAAGDHVVGDGSFFLRAERDRLGLRATAAAPTAAPTPHASIQTVKVVVGERGYDPATITVHAGTPVRITFVRTTDKTCGTEVVFPSLNLRRELPLNQPVTIDFTPAKTGELAFVCGMNMLEGRVVVQ